MDRPGADAKYNYESAPRQLVQRAEGLADACERHGVTLPQAALAYPLLHPAVVSVVVGMRTGRQVEGNIERFRAQIPPTLWNDLVAEGLISATPMIEETP